MNASSLRKLVAALAATALLGGLIIFDALAADLNKLVEDCANCHSKNGSSTEPTVPTIGGISELYIIDTIAIYKDRERPCIEAEYLEGADKGSKTDMCKIADELSDGDIEALAKFYTSKDFVPAKQSFDPEKAARGQKIHDVNCEKCHEDGGSSKEDDAGVLAGQWMPYLEQTFKSYASGERVMAKKMKPKMDKLTDQGKDDLLHYYGSLQ
jgi:sulfide dehydrogenase cytochrome subunit